MPTANEILYILCQQISPDDNSTLNEEVIEAALEVEGIDPNEEATPNAALMALAYKILGIDAPPSPSENALIQDAQAASSVADALRHTEDGHVRETEDGQLRRTE